MLFEAFSWIALLIAQFQALPHVTLFRSHKGFADEKLLTLFINFVRYLNTSDLSRNDTPVSSFLDCMHLNVAAMSKKQVYIALSTAHVQKITKSWYTSTQRVTGRK
jgi:hypothetical protein